MRRKFKALYMRQCNVWLSPDRVQVCFEANTRYEMTYKMFKLSMVPGVYLMSFWHRS